MGTKITKNGCEITGKMKIAELLSLMGFHDEDPAATIENMLRKLHRINQEKHKNPPTIKKMTIKVGGKKLHLNLTKGVSVEASSSKTVGSRPVDDMEIDGSTSYSIFYENPNLDIHGFITSMGGSEAELVIEKRLTKSDCDKNLGRLLIPALQVRNPGFLEMNEKEKLWMRESISVEVFDPKRRKLTLNLVQWNMKNENYVLKTNWKRLVVTNGLKDNMVIRVWAFRVKRKLCFAVVQV